MICANCQRETTNPKFCSRSCAAIYTNKASPKRKLIRTCSQCESVVKSYRHTRCALHWQEYKDTLWKNKTLGEYRNRHSVKGKHPSWINVHVRLFAKSWLKKDKTVCEHCGYDKHVEIAHIQAVTSFPDTALMSEVNSKDNVKMLCPNCHWEFDNLPRN